jgi:putative Mg2+ transporter-C (MgtC) family protein
LRDLISSLGPELLASYDLVLRLMLAAALGGMIGLEREYSGKPAGFRTNLLICLGAALITEVSYSVARAATGEFGGNPDPGRIAAQIVSGIGFLGAGSILHARGGVTGLTTAATLWVVAAIGMAVGARAYVAAVFATTLVMLALMLLGRVEDHLIAHRPSERNVDVKLGASTEAIGDIEKQLLALGYRVDTLRVERTADGVQVGFHVSGPPEKWDFAIKAVLAVPGVERVELT